MELFSCDPLPRPHRRQPIREFKVMTLREFPSDATMLDSPPQCVSYWRDKVQTNPYHEPAVECFVVLCLNVRRRIMCHKLVSTGTLDTILVHPREVFRPAICIAAAAIILMHNHPSGDPTPSEADIKVTRDLIQAGQLMKIDVLDHVIVGQACLERPKDYCSLRELGYFYS